MRHELQRVDSDMVAALVVAAGILCRNRIASPKSPCTLSAEQLFRAFTLGPG